MKPFELTASSVRSAISVNLFTRVGVVTLNVLAAIIVARHLGPDSFGQYTFFVTLFLIAGLLAHCGLEASLVNQFSIRKRIYEVLAASVLLKGTAAIVALLILTAIIVKSYSSSLILIISASLLLGSKFGDSFKFLLEARRRFSTLFGILILSSLVSFGLKISLTQFSYDFQHYVLVNALAAFLSATLFVLLSEINIIKLARARKTKLIAKRLFCRSYPIFAGAVFATIYLKVDILMMQWLSSPTQLGLYSVAARISELWYFIPVAVMTAVFPSIAHARRSAPHTYELLMRRVLKGFFYFTVVVCGIFFFAAESIVGLLFGRDFLSAAEILSIHILASLFYVPRLVFSKWLIVERLEKFSIVTQIAGAVVNVGLNFWLIPLYGGVGAAIATATGYGVAGFFSLFFFRETRAFLRLYFFSVFDFLNTKK